VTKARLRVHDLSRRNHQDTVETLLACASDARNTHSDGVIVILVDKTGQPSVKIGGKLAKNEAALMHLAKLSMSVILDHE